MVLLVWIREVPVYSRKWLMQRYITGHVLRISGSRALGPQWDIYIIPEGCMNIEEEDVEEGCRVLLPEHGTAATVMNTQ